MLYKDEHSRLVLHKLEYLVFLGWGLAERKKRQKVTVDIDIQLLHPPTACATDSIDDTLCYDILHQTIKKSIAKKKFRLLEHLTYEMYSIIKLFLNVKNKTTICVTKYPDAFFTSAGVSFIYSDKRFSKRKK